MPMRNSKGKSAGRKAAAVKPAPAKMKSQTTRSAASPHLGAATTDIRKDYKKTLLGRYLAKSVSAVSTGRR